jgi:PIN domain nuclease of toxin-antitoxin system
VRLLLDTHVFLWWTTEPQKLTQDMRAFCEDSANTLLLSVASVWEMQIKIQLDKLRLTLPLRELIESEQATNKIELLPILIEHVFALQQLLPHHKDPFDRLLIAQSIVDDVAILTADSDFSRYSVRLAGR